MPDSNPLISILLSVRNGERDLPETLQSIHNQRGVRWELVAVDDASTDASGSLLTAFAQEHPGKVLIVTNQTNQGLTKSLIHAAAKARGELLARLDAGDAFLPEKLHLQSVYLMDHPEVGIVGSNYENVDERTGVRTTSKVPLTDADIRRTILRRNPFAHSCILLRAAVYHTAGGYNPRQYLSQDYDLWFRVLRVSQAANLSQVLCLRKVAEASLSLTKQRRQMWGAIAIQWRYGRRWDPRTYLSMLEPLAVLLTPRPLKRVLRSMVNRSRP